jgi:hypothetical protein
VAGPLEVVTRFTSDTGGLEQGAQKAGGLLDGFGGSALAAAAGPLALAAGAAAAVGAIVEMTKAAAEDQTEQAKLEAAIQAAGAATGDYKSQVDAAIAAGQAKAFSDTQTREALQSLVTATGDVTEATGLLSTAQDVARFAGVDLATAADAVAKAQAGNDGALRKLIPGLEKGKTATDTLAAAQQAAAGQADAFASSTEGSMAIAQDSFGELGETIGSAFLPIIAAIVPKLIPIIQKLGVLIEAVIPVLIPLVEGLAMELGLFVDVLVAVIDVTVKVIQWLGPKLEPILKALTAAFGVVGDAIKGVVGWLSDLLGWIGRAVGAIGDLLDKLNPLKGFSLPNISLPFSAPAPAAPAARSGLGGARLAAAAPASSVVIHVSSADPGEVVRALRRWAGNNGGSGPLLRSLDRAAS